MKYEKRYKDVLTWMESVYPELSHERQMEAEAFFPELAEPEEEKIRKALIDFFSEPGRKEYILKRFTVNDILSWLEKQSEQKSDWNEEDDQYLLICRNALAKYETTDKWDAGIISHWLEDKFKSLKPQKQDITYKDFEDIIHEIKTRIVQCNGFNRKHREEVFNLLDSLSPQNKWKPSNEQMVAIKEAMNIIGILTITGSELNSLYQDLKKLREK